MNKIKGIVKKVRRELSYIVQGSLYIIGISTHNKVTNECCSDFSCCVKECKTKGIKKRAGYVAHDFKRIFRGI